MSAVFTGTLFHCLKETIDEIVTDKSDGLESRLVWPKWMAKKGMEDNYEDDLEIAGPGLAAEVPEGSEIPTGTIREGYLTRYRARKFGLRLVITEEAIEDNKYDKAIDGVNRLKKAVFDTQEIDATNILVRAVNASYPGGDGLPLGSASHPLAQGGTFSNIMATPMTPSRMAVIAATSQIKKFPGHDGVVGRYMPAKVIAPTEQWALWEGLVKSEKAPEPGAFNEINVVNKMSLEVVTNQYWDNTATNWGMITDAENGLQMRIRRAPKSRSWVENSQELMNYSISSRWDRKWSDARCILFVNS